LVELLRQRHVPVETGRFGAVMEVELVNDGPVTLVIERASEVRRERSE
jgi:D-tyrosyl-tRNA(Tyr) deacylase